MGRTYYLVVIGLLLLVFSASIMPGYSQDDPVEVRIVIDEPMHDGLYLQNDRINMTIYFINHGDEPLDLGYSFVVTHIETDKTLANLESGFNTIQPNSNFSYPLSRGYSAGNYRVYASAFANYTSFNDSKEFFFWVATPLELYTKQSLNYTLYGVIISAVVAGATVATTIWTRRANEQQRKDTKDYVDKQLKLQEDSTKALQESNRLTRESLKLKQAEFKASLGKPIIADLNTGLEVGGGNPNVRLYPNFRLDGKLPITNLRIFYKKFDKLVTKWDIAKAEMEIKDRIIMYPGTIFPGDSINFNTPTAKFTSIQWEPADKPISVVVWFVYDYLEDQHDETIFDIHYSNKSYYADGKPNRYTLSDIEKARSSL